MNKAPTYNELEDQIALLLKQIETLKSSEKSELNNSSGDSTQEVEKNPTFSTDNPLYVITADLNDIITDINYTGGGFSKEDLIGKRAIDFVNVEYHSLVKASHQKVKQEGVQVSYESISIGLDNITRHFITHVIPIIVDDIVTGLTLITKDITENKTVLHSLKVSKEKIQKNESDFRSTIENLLVGVVVHSNDTQVLYSNREASNILGLSAEQMLGKVVIDPAWMFVNEDLTPMKLEDYPINKVINSKKPFTNYICGVVRQDRSFITWVNVNAMPFFDYNDSKLERVVINFIDITENKQSVQALIESQRIGAIGEMASSVAHDFNNSLQAIYGNVELALLDYTINEQTHNYLKIIKKVVNDVANRVQLLQRFGHTSQLKSNQNLVSLHVLFEEVILQTRPLWKDDSEKNGCTINIKTNYSDIPDILCNDAEMRTVFYNIIKNSIEAMPTGGDLTIEGTKSSENVIITISDTGIGMDEETKARIFQPFFTTKGFELGRGLGMSGVYGIVKDHGCDIYIKNSELGKGTILEILIPMTHEHEINEKEDLPKKTEGTNTLFKVLWVEDDAIIRLNAGLMLKKAGHTVDTASSGKKALEHLEKNTYDIVITDIGMPEMNGWQLADIIKEKYNGEIQVAVVSGWGREIDESDIKKHGVISVISKPFDFDQITTLFENVEKNRRKK